ncbi:hypothetical protein [Aeromicrobium sp. A1-2]|uniref:variant leucine-rich repeat-containing protein n=1 Tax=Aeromicrobium sp. A1-2 TaxID=2107713 RepID=UPI001C1FE9B8|nr:hypothetical protein [Aeromicrobium sp. A1-2]
MESGKLMREAADPATTPARLQEIAQEDRTTWTAIAANPSAYPGLLEWLTEHGDDEVRAAVTAREAVVTPPPPPPPPPLPPGPPAPPAPTASSSADDTLIEPTSVAAAATESAPAQGVDGDSNKNTVRAVGILVAAALVIGGGLFAANALGDDDDGKPSFAASSRSDDVKDDEPSSGGSKPEFCAAMKNVQEIGLDAVKSMPSAGATPDLEDIAAGAADQLERVEDAYDALAQSAPTELKADIAVLTKYMATMGDMAAGEVDGDDPFEASDMDGYVEASQNLAKYFYAECG